MTLSKRDILEILGGITVVVSLLFVGIQVMQERQSIQSQSVRDVFSGLRAFGMELATNDEAANLFLSGLSDYDSLNQSEKFQFSFLIGDYILGFREAQTAYEQDVLSYEDFNALGLGTGRFLKTPGGSSWWESVSYQYSDDLKELIESYRAISPDLFEVRPDLLGN